MKFLIFTTDILPTREIPSSGTAIRTFGLGQGLAELGHELSYSVPRHALQRIKASSLYNSLSAESKQALAAMEARAFDLDNQDQLLRQEKADCLICGHWPAMMLGSKTSVPLIIDLAGPHLLERYYQGEKELQGSVLAKLNNLATADYYIVSGPKQRLYFLSFLQRAGVQCPEKRFIEIPMPLNPVLPKERAQDSRANSPYPTFFFGGVFLPWQDPTQALSLLVHELERRKSGQLSIVGGAHATYDFQQGAYGGLLESLKNHPQLKIRSTSPFDSYVSELLGADVALDLMSWNLERELAVTIRTTTELWAGLPVIYNDYADLSTLISRYDAGWCIAPQDESALLGVIEEIYAHPKRVSEKGANARRLAREHFSWTRSAQAIVDLLQGKEGLESNQTDIFSYEQQSASLPLCAGKTVEQYFLSRLAGLSRVQFFLNPQGHHVKLPVRVRLWMMPVEGFPKKIDCPIESRSLLAEKEISPEHLLGESWQAIELSAPLDSRGKVFLLELSSQESNPQNALSPWALRRSPYPLLGLFYGRERLDDTSLCLKTSSRTQVL